MRSPSAKSRLVLLACIALFAAGAIARGTQSLAPHQLDARESRGKQIYLRGTSPSGKEIRAYVGESALEVPGDAMSCANCHGLDGRGKPEGGVTPSNLNWEILTKPYGLTHQDGRKHPPYTERALELAITRGTDPGGNRLQRVMPRYEMSPEDLADLIVYLKRLGKDRDPGISDDRIVIGTAVPSKGALAEWGSAVTAVTAAFFDEVNRQGGVYNRRLELKVAVTGENSAAARADLERMLEAEQVFAMSGAVVAGFENELLPLMAEKKVPLIGPFTLLPSVSFPINREVFYLLSGVEERARALAGFAAKMEETKATGFAVVYTKDAINERIIIALTRKCQKEGLPAPAAYPYIPSGLDPGAVVTLLKQGGRNGVFFLGPGSAALSLMKAADGLGWYPHFFVPGVLAEGEMFAAPAGFDGRILFSLPTSPDDQSEKGIDEFAALAERYKLPRQHLPAQFSAYTAAKILVEGLRRAGRDLSRDKLITALEGLFEFRTELTPAITYGPNRRIGAMGAYVVKADLKAKRLVPASGWIGVE
jgi:ABC-type branched-subunit amino acid transport system substrate-binding protein